ncbi:MAG: hypothetical protein V1818_01085 [Candidatus Aenigmatarchaeota archaeon]
MTIYKLDAKDLPEVFMESDSINVSGGILKLTKGKKTYYTQLENAINGYLPLERGIQPELAVTDLWSRSRLKTGYSTSRDASYGSKVSQTKVEKNYDSYKSKKGKVNPFTI